MSIDLLVFGPHPDDIEIGLGGTVARHAAAGDHVGLCDLTEGELSSNGTVEVRRQEAAAAARVLGAAFRENLRWPDGGITGTDSQLLDIVRLIRRTRPRTVALPYWEDRHPDHRTASDVLSRAAFKSGLRRFAPDLGEAWRPDWICYYFINDSAPESFGIDVSAHYETKRRALACHRSQFTPTATESVSTRLTVPQFQQLIESRDAHLGARAGVAFAEAVVVREPILRPHLIRDWHHAPRTDRP